MWMLRCLTSAEDRTAQYSFRLYFSLRQYSSLGYLQPFVRQWLTESPRLRVHAIADSGTVGVDAHSAPRQRVCEPTG